MAASIPRAPERSATTYAPPARRGAGVAGARGHVTLADCIDTDHAPDVSIVRRYRHAFTFGTPSEDQQFKDLLVATSIREGVRVLPFVQHKGVEVWLLDETSRMHTRTLKSVDGCFTTARCKLAGLERIVLETGGNSGAAFTAYGTRVGLETYCFLPADNLGLLNSAWFESPLAHLVAVEDPGAVKRAAHLFAQAHDLPHIPRLPWRYEAARFRGLAILEFMVEHGRFDWIAQSISGAFGPIGIYQSLREFGRELGMLPRFLGVQQEANCPMYRSWKRGRRVSSAEPLTTTTQLLARTMYDVKPQTYGSFRDLLALLKDTRGEILTIGASEFDAMRHADFAGQSLYERLARDGIHIGPDVVERTGLMALAGTLKLIDAGGVPRGQRVLCCLTSGMSAADGRARAEFTIPSLQSAVNDYARQLAQDDTRA